MLKISKVRTKVRDGKPPLIILIVEGREEPVFLTGKQVRAATGISGNFTALVGCKIDVTFYKEGDEMAGGAKYEGSDEKIVKEFEITLKPSLKDMSDAAAVGLGMFSRSSDADW